MISAFLFKVSALFLPTLNASKTASFVTGRGGFFMFGFFATIYLSLGSLAVGWNKSVYASAKTGFSGLLMNTVNSYQSYFATSNPQSAKHRLQAETSFPNRKIERFPADWLAVAPAHQAILLRQSLLPPRLHSVASLHPSG